MALKTIQKTKKQIEAEALLRELGKKFCKECEDIVDIKEFDGRVHKCFKCATIKPQEEIVSVYKALIKVMISYSYCTNRMQVHVANKDEEPKVVLEGHYEDVYERLQWTLINLGLGDYEWE